jgi:hypothetical protein
VVFDTQRGYLACGITEGGGDIDIALRRMQFCLLHQIGNRDFSFNAVIHTEGLCDKTESVFVTEPDPNRNHDYTQARRQAKRRVLYRRMREALEKLRDEPGISTRVRALVDEGLDDSVTEEEITPRFTIGSIQDEGYRIILRSESNPNFFVAASHFQAGHAQLGDVVTYEPVGPKKGWFVSLSRQRPKRSSAKKTSDR